MKTQDVGQAAWGDSREPPDEAKYESLRAGDSQFPFQPLRRSVEPVVDGPDQSEELEDFIEPRYLSFERIGRT